MHWEKQICVRLTIRRIVIAILAASTVANLVIVGVVFGADSPATTSTVTSVLPTPLSTNTFLIPISGTGEASALTQIPGITPIDTFTPTPTSTDSPIWIVCIKRFYWPSYPVQPGDRLFALALATGSSVAELMVVNCLKSDQIYAGQVLYVPRQLSKIITPTNTPTVMQTPTNTMTDTPTDTPTATATPSPTPTYTPTPTPTATPTDSPTPTPTATSTPTPTVLSVACDQAEFVADITVPPGTVMAPGAIFVKIWRLKNIGRCTWTTSYSFVFIGGELFGVPKENPLYYNVAPGQTIEISFDMTAPVTTGYYQGRWMFRNANGLVFGIGPQADKPWSVEINVSDPPATPTPILVGLVLKKLPKHRSYEISKVRMLRRWRNFLVMARKTDGSCRPSFMPAGCYAGPAHHVNHHLQS